MNKKSRFSMLGIEPEKHSQQNNKPSGKMEATEPPRHIKKSIDVIIKQEDFQKNLEQYKLRNQEKEIQHQKNVIESRILRMKFDAWAKIILGILIIASAGRKYLWGEESHKYLGNGATELIITQSTLSPNDYILIALIIAFIYVMFFANKKKR